MANLHVAAGGSNTAPYDTWAKAASSVVVAAAAAAAGDTIYFDSTYTDSASGQTITFTNATATAPVSLICGTQSGASGISALATGGNVTSTSTVFTLTGDVYIYGMTFQGSSASTTPMNLNVSAKVQTHENCTYYISNGAGANSRVNFGYNVSASSNAWTRLINPTFRFAATSGGVGINGRVDIRGGIQHASSADISPFFFIGNHGLGGIARVYGFDFTNCGAAFAIFSANTTSYGTARNCKLPTSWTGNPGTVGTSNSNTWELFNYGINGATGSNYKFYCKDTLATLTDDSTIYRNGGASDEVTPYSMKMVTPAASGWPSHYGRSLPMIQRVAASVGGVPDTVVVHVTHDRATALTDKEIWIEVEYLGTSDYPLALFANDGVALLTGLTGSGTAQTTSSETWTGTSGFTNPQTIQVAKASLNFTMAGYISVTVCIAAPSITAYICPKVTVS